MALPILKAKQKKDKITLKVDLDNYKGNIKVSEQDQYIIYYFINEQIEKKFKIF